MILRTLLEFAAICLLIYGYAKEDKIIRFEQDCVAIVKACRAQHIGPVKLYKMYKERYK